MGLTDLRGLLEVTCSRHVDVHQLCEHNKWPLCHFVASDCQNPFCLLTEAPEKPENLGLIGRLLTCDCWVQRYTCSSSIALNMDTLRHHHTDPRAPYGTEPGGSSISVRHSLTYHIVPYLAPSLPDLTSPVSTSISQENTAYKGSAGGLLLKNQTHLAFKCQGLNSNSDLTIHSVN